MDVLKHSACLLIFVLAMCTLSASQSADLPKLDPDYGAILRVVENLDKRISLLESENGKLVKQVGFLEEKNGQQEKRISFLETENEKMTKRVAFLEKENKQQLTRNSLYANENKHLDKRVKRETNDNAELTTPVRRFEKDHAGPSAGDAVSEGKPRAGKGHDVNMEGKEDHRVKSRTQRAAPEVAIAFYASLASHVHHLCQDQNVRFDKVTTNIGNAYDVATGAFKAPIAGVYVFSTTIVTYGQDTTHYGYALNGNHITNIFINADSTGGYGISQSVILDLAAGDDISIQHHDFDKSLYGDNYSVFSGFLLSENEGSVIVG